MSWPSSRWSRTRSRAAIDPRLTDLRDALKAASKDMQAAGMFFMENGMKNPNDALAGSTDFMHLFGHVCLGMMWLAHGPRGLCRA